MAPKKVVDVTQREAGDDKDWVNEPYDERNESLTAHTERPYNAEPPNRALRHMITPKGEHYRRQHTPVPVVDPETYRLSVGVEGKEPRLFSLEELRKYKEHDMAVTFMCTGNRRSEMNTADDGETMGLPWKNGSISTARWAGCSFREVLKDCGIELDSAEDDGYNFITFYGLEAYHISIPMSKALSRHGDVIFAWNMNGEPLPRDHGFPLRVIVPGFVGARSVKWLEKVVLTKTECEGMHQRGIAYKQLGPNIKSLAMSTKEYIESMPPIDHVPITGAVTLPEPGAKVARGQPCEIQGYAYSGAGLAVIRVDVSVDGGVTWGQATMQRADETQGIRSGKAWAWVQWKYTATIPSNAPAKLSIFSKGVDDQYNQQPHNSSAIWNIRGILNTAWGRADVIVVDKDELDMAEGARSGDGTVEQVGIKMNGEFKCPDCRQQFDDKKALDLHWRFIHDPTRHQED